MMTKKYGRFDIVVVEGELEATGTGVMDYSGSVFSVATFSDGSALRNILTGDVGNLRFRPGEKGRFVFLRLGRLNVFVGLDDDDGGYFIDDGVAGALVKRQLNLGGIYCVLIGIPLLIVYLIGIPVILWGIWQIVQAANVPADSARNVAIMRLALEP